MFDEAGASRVQEKAGRAGACVEPLRPIPRANNVQPWLQLRPGIPGHCQSNPALRRVQWSTPCQLSVAAPILPRVQLSVRQVWHAVHGAQPSCFRVQRKHQVRQPHRPRVRHPVEHQLAVGGAREGHPHRSAGGYVRQALRSMQVTAFTARRVPPGLQQLS